MAVRLDGIGPVGIHAVTTTRADGDFAIGSEPGELAVRRARLVDRPWVWVRQIHGGDVVVVSEGDADRTSGREADAIVTADPGLVLAVQTADCLPVVLHSAEGVVGVAHAGWRGLRDGVVQKVADAMRRLGATEVGFTTGPCIGPECYEFGEPELDELASLFGDEVRGTTAAGGPSLDMHRAFDVVRRRAGIGEGRVCRSCTACDAERWFSHRARGETARMATVVWRESVDSTTGIAGVMP